MRGTKIMWVGVAIIAAVSIFIAGLATGARLGSRGIMIGNFADGFNSAKTMLDKTGLIPQTPNKIITIGGVVKDVDNNNITLTVSRVTPNPLDDQGPTERVVVVSDKTSIIALVPLSTQEMIAANTAFQADIAAHKAATPPPPFKKVAMKVSDIKVGTVISVTASDDIRDASKIVAEEITFQGAPPLTSPAPAKKK